MLTTDQLQALDRHLRKENWLLNEELIAELKDHYIAGIEEHITHGMTFDNTIREIHTGFGGRKGLLKMEEEYQKAQARNNGRIIRQQIASYFRLPRLGITCLLLILVYNAIQMFPYALTLIWGNSWLFIGLMSCTAMSYILAFVHLINYLKQTNKAKAFNNELRVSIQVISSFMFLGIYVRIWLPVEQVLLRYPFISSIIITGFVIIELATTELLWEHLYKNKKPKLA